MSNNSWTDELKELIDSEEPQMKRDLWPALEQRLDAAPATGGRVWFRRVAVAAAILCGVAAGTVFIFNKDYRADMLADAVEEVSVNDKDINSIEEIQQEVILRSPRSVRKEGCSVMPSVEYEDVVVPSDDASQFSEPSLDCYEVALKSTDSQQPDEELKEPNIGQQWFEESEPTVRKKVTLTTGLLADSHISLPNISNIGKDYVYDSQSTDVLYDNCYATASSHSEEIVADPMYGRALTRAVNSVKSYDKSHHDPLSLGLTLNVNLDPGYFIQTGVEYTLHRSTYTLTSGSLIWKDMAGSSSERLREHYIGIPISFGYRFIRGNVVSFYGMTGIELHKCVGATLGSTSVKEKGVQFSASVSAGLEFHLGPLLNLYLAPNFSYFFTDTTYETYWSEHPAGFNLRTGLSFNL